MSVDRRGIILARDPDCLAPFGAFGKKTIYEARVPGPALRWLCATASFAPTQAITVSPPWGFGGRASDSDSVARATCCPCRAATRGGRSGDRCQPASTSTDGGRATSCGFAAGANKLPRPPAGTPSSIPDPTASRRFGKCAAQLECPVRNVRPMSIQELALALQFPGGLLQVVPLRSRTPGLSVAPVSSAPRRPARAFAALANKRCENACPGR